MVSAVLCCAPCAPIANAPTRFGNFIGEDPEASEEGSEQGDADADDYVYGDDEEVDEDGVGQELMEVDGRFTRAPSWAGSDIRLSG